MIVPFEGNEAVYNAGFQQSGYGMPRYRGSPMLGGSFWGRIIGFAKGLFSKAAPYVSSLITQAQHHVKRVAAQAVDFAIDKAVTHVTEKLKQKQEGSGKKRKKLRKPKLKKLQAVKWPI